MTVRVWLLIPLCTIGSMARAADTEPATFFRDKIEPVLKAECYQCHSREAREVQAGLLLDSRQGLLRGGDTGPAIVPGKSADSLLVQALRHENGVAMPPKMPRLPEATIANFARWINEGAVDPRTEDPPSDPLGLTAARQHWAFQPVRRLSPPTVQSSAQVTSPVDAFILQSLEA